jgi:hypothetical protein
MRRHRFLPAALGIAALALAVPIGLASAAPDPLAAVRQATVGFHELAAAEAAGYGEFYICTDNEAERAAMGQHYADVSRVVDPTIDPLDPEVLIYEPKPGGGYRLVGVEYVVFAADWDALHGDPPSLFGKRFTKILAGNRYGLPDFYQLHAWIWKGNPRGVFDDWNSNVSCRGNGDPA